jgi:hypothetical protein
MLFNRNHANVARWFGQGVELMVNCWGLKVLWYGRVCAGRTAVGSAGQGGTGAIVRYVCLSCITMPCTYRNAYQSVKFGSRRSGVGDTAAEAV